MSLDEIMIIAQSEPFIDVRDNYSGEDSHFATFHDEDGERALFLNFTDHKLASAHISGDESFDPSPVALD